MFSFLLGWCLSKYSHDTRIFFCVWFNASVIFLDYHINFAQANSKLCGIYSFFISLKCDGSLIIGFGFRLIFDDFEFVPFQLLISAYCVFIKAEWLIYHNWDACTSIRGEKLYFFTCEIVRTRLKSCERRTKEWKHERQEMKTNVRNGEYQGVLE